MPLKTVTPEDRLITAFIRIHKDIDLAIREYQAETAESRPRKNKRIFYEDPTTGKQAEIRGARK
jgi:hypothetical protein